MMGVSSLTLHESYQPHRAREDTRTSNAVRGISLLRLKKFEASIKDSGADHPEEPRVDMEVGPEVRLRIREILRREEGCERVFVDETLIRIRGREYWLWIVRALPRQVPDDAPIG